MSKMPPRLPHPGEFTNIGTSNLNHPRWQKPLPARPGTDAVSSGRTPSGLPISLPIAQFEGETPGGKFIAPEPLWISRWQNTATVPASDGPWVTGYRWYVAGVIYADRGEMEHYEIQCMFKDGHRHWYRVPRDVWEEFRGLKTSVGQWIHDRILGKGWNNKNRQCKYDNGPL